MALETFSAPAFLVSLTESADYVVFAYDLENHCFLYLNAAFEKVWRKRRRNVMDNPACLIKKVHPEEKAHVLAVYQELLEGIIIKEIEFRIKLRDNTERWVCLKPVLLEESGLISGFVSDITPQKEYNDYLKKFSDKKNAVLNILSHDLAQPLGNIQALSNLLASDLQDGKMEEAQI